MLPVVVCTRWVKVVAQKTCCVQRNPQWCGRGVARIEHGNEQEYGKKTGFPLNTTINHRSGEGVENKTKVQKNRNKSTQKDPKTAMACNNATKNEHVLDKKNT